MLKYISNNDKKVFIYGFFIVLPLSYGLEMIAYIINPSQSYNFGSYIFLGWTLISSFLFDWKGFIKK